MDKLIHSRSLTAVFTNNADFHWSIAARGKVGRAGWGYIPTHSRTVHRWIMMRSTGTAIASAGGSANKNMPQDSTRGRGRKNESFTTI